MLIDDIGAEFARVTEAAASDILTERYGFPATRVTRLSTERDDSFRVESEVGEFVFKIAHPADDPLVVNLQTAAMAFANDVDPGIPLQQILPTLDGEAEGTLETDAGSRVMRVLTWLPGTLLRTAELTPDRLYSYGAMQARLVSALEDFRHPAADRTIAWDVAALAELRPALEFAPDLEAFVDHFVGLSDRVAALPRQVIHNDLNLDNVVTDAASPDFITGLIDFGDTLTTARVIDLAVSLSYLVPTTGDASTFLEPVLEGYRSRIVLTPDELDLLPDLVRARIAQRILIPAYLAAHHPGNAEYTGRSLALSRAQFAVLG
jgi:Ser/Thr protein kinase RdoA (MazF antagonist)